MRIIAFLTFLSFFALVSFSAEPAPAAPVKNTVPPLPENVTIHIKGTINEDTSVDMELSGIGPDFSCSLPMPITSFSGQVTTAENSKLLLEYKIRTSVPMITKNESPPPSPKMGERDGVQPPNVPATPPPRLSIQYTNFSLEGKILIGYGEPFKVATANGKDFTITITKYADTKKSPAK